MWDDHSTTLTLAHMPVSSGDLATLEMQGRKQKNNCGGNFRHSGFLLWLNHYREFGRNEMKWWKYLFGLWAIFLKRIAGHFRSKDGAFLFKCSLAQGPTWYPHWNWTIPTKKKSSKKRNCARFKGDYIFLFQDGYCYGMSYQKLPCNTYNV